MHITVNTQRKSWYDTIKKLIMMQRRSDLLPLGEGLACHNDARLCMHVTMYVTTLVVTFCDQEAMKTILSLV